MQKKNPVVHFEVPYEDKKRVSDFYTNAFGWDMKDQGAEMGDYILAGTSEVGSDGFPKEKGRINGGFFKKSGETGSAALLTIAVDDIKEAMEAVKNAGGKVLGEPVDIPGVGMYVAIIDTEGNRASVLEPKGM